MRQELLAYGLSEKEADLYLAALKAGSCSANRLSELTGIRRSTVYEVAESLKRKGLLSSLERDKKFLFTAATPDVLLSTLEGKMELAKSMIPMMRKIAQSVPERPQLTLHEGIVSIRQAFEQMLQEKEILVYGAAKAGEQAFKSYPANFAKRRVERRIMMKAVIDPELPEHMLEPDVKRFTQIRTLKALQGHTSAYFIYGDRVLILTLGEELIAVSISSLFLADSQRKIFFLLWSIADAP